MNIVQASLQAVLPAKRKNTTGGWISFNAPCCAHRGERPDTRKRGGVVMLPDGFTYHCFNCNFKAGWTPGKSLSQNAKLLFKWLGMPDDDIGKLVLESIKSKDTISTERPDLDFLIKEKPLPPQSKPIIQWLEEGYAGDDLVAVIEYILHRGFDIDDYNWHWSTMPGYRDRVIIPMYHEGKIAGNTARRITDGKNRYLTSSQPGYVFNIDAQHYEREFVIVTEGQFDAIAVDGVAIHHNEPNEVQCARINALGKQVIVVPDRDKAGAVMLNAALEHKWSVSLPPWGDDIKDVAAAMKKFGKLYVLSTILHYRETNHIKIEVLKKRLEHLDDKK